jgi:hypothetical protein
MPSSLERQTRTCGHFLNSVQSDKPQVILNHQVNAIPVRRYDTPQPGNSGLGVIGIERPRRCWVQTVPLQDWFGS